jgi:hypothetical protein
MPDPTLLMAQVTDPFGQVESEPLVVRLEGGFVHLELEDGRSLLVDAGEIREAVKHPCGFCHGRPVGDAASWVDGKPRPPAPCPRCGETNQEAA